MHHILYLHCTTSRSQEPQQQNRIAHQISSVQSSIARFSNHFTRRIQNIKTRFASLSHDSSLSEPFRRHKQIKKIRTNSRKEEDSVTISMSMCRFSIWVCGREMKPDLSRVEGADREEKEKWANV
ncbi:hypothetical protein LXL04_012076 [Taraxacum kok-saghyz]